MTKTSETVVFFGSGPVAAESLRQLAENFVIEAVVTKPRAKHHKGDVPVLTVATQLGLHIHTAADKQALNTLFDDVHFSSRVAILVDFGIIVSQAVIDSFPLGIVNSHFSLLPMWRGADPITFAILNGDPVTGVSLMLLVEKMDEGPLLAQAPLMVPADCTTPELTDVLIDSSNQTLQFIVPKYLKGDVQPMPQDMSMKVSYSRKLTKDDGVIDWHKPAVQLEREIRAFIEWPKSHTTLAGHEVIITKVRPVPSVAVSAKPGDIDVVKEPGVIMVATGNGSLCIEKLKPAGKAEMTSKAFLAGYGKSFLSK